MITSTIAGIPHHRLPQYCLPPPLNPETLDGKRNVTHWLAQVEDSSETLSPRFPVDFDLIISSR